MRLLGKLHGLPLGENGSTNVVVEAYNSEGSITQTFSIYFTEDDYPEDLTALWKFDNSSFEYEYINQHQLIGSASQTTGLIDGAANFNGTSGNIFYLEDSYEEIAAEIFFDFPSRNYSVSFWMNSSVTGEGTKVAIGRDVPSNNTSWWIGFDSETGEAVWYATDYDDTNSDEVYISGGVVNDGSWHLITVVRNESNDMDYLYVDGIMVNSASSNHAGFGGNTPLFVGGFNIAPYYYFDGLMDELSFFNSALSQSRIQTIYNDGILGKSILKENHLPFFTSTIETVAYRDVFYRDTVYDDIDEGDIVTPSITGLPDWLNFNYTFGNNYFILSGTPTNISADNYSMTLKLNDGTSTISQSLIIDIENNIDDPIIPPSPIANDVSAVEGQENITLFAEGENIKWYSDDIQPIKDDRDGQEYEIVKIGDQFWMKENLNYYTKTGSYYYNNDSVLYASEYGRLYNWETAAESCPLGWRLPSDND